MQSKVKNKRWRPYCYFVQEMVVRLGIVKSRGTTRHPGRNWLLNLVAAPNGLFDCIEQVFIAERLGEEFDRSKPTDSRQLDIEHQAAGTLLRPAG